MKEARKQLDAGIWTMEFFAMEQRGTMPFCNFIEEKEDVNNLDLFFKPSTLQLIQRLTQKMVKKTRCYLPQKL